MARTVTAQEDWLSFALAELDTEKIAAANKRAEVALKVRLDARVSRFLKRADDYTDLGIRLDAVDESVKEIVNEVATQYKADPELLMEAAIKKIAYDFDMPYGTAQQGTPTENWTGNCPNCGFSPFDTSAPCPKCGYKYNPAGAPAPGGGSLRDRIMQGSTKTADGVEIPVKPQAHDYERIDPDKTIGEGAEAVSQSYEYNSDVEDALGQSKDHPREHQDISQYVEDRRTINDQDDKDVGVKRHVDHIDPEKAIGEEQKGVGGTFERGTQADAVTSKFHILD